MEFILGCYERNVDNKGRFIIPYQFNFKEGEEVCLVRENDLALRIYRYEIFKERLEMYNKLINTQYTQEIEKNRDFLATGLISKSELDSQKRILIPSIIRKEYTIIDSLYLTGSSDHIKIFSNNENYKQYRKQL